jgi:hypothetical protein
MISRLKTTIRSALNLFGYDIVRKSVVTDLGYCLFMRKIHCNDAVERFASKTRHLTQE